MITGDERGIIADWLIKVVVGIAIFGVIAYDTGSILVNTFTLDSGANDVAIAVSIAVDDANRTSQFTPQEVQRLATAVVESPDNGIANAKVLPQGTFVDQAGVVHINLRRTAHTLIVGRIGAIKKWARATADGQAGTT